MEPSHDDGGGGGPGSGSGSGSGSHLPIMFFDGRGTQPRAVKRPRPVKSCLECRKRKLKCDRLSSCSQCQKSQRACKYSADQENGGGGLSDGSEPETPERPTKRPQRVLASVGAGTGAAVVAPPPAPPSHHGSPEGSHTHSLASFHAGSAGTGDVQTNQSAAAGTTATIPMMEEMTARIEHLERLLLRKDSSADIPSVPVSATASRPGGGYPNNNNHHHHHHRIPAPAMTIRSLSVKGNLRTRFFGQNSTKVLLNLFEEARECMRDMGTTDGMRELFRGLKNVYRTLSREHHKTLEPITVFVDSMMPIQKRMSDILPKKGACDRLLDAYIGMSEGLYRVVHLPTFRAEYEAYWGGQGCHDSFLPRLLCMTSIASRFETDARGFGHDRTDSVHVPTACALVRNWVDSLRGKQLVDINTLQTEILLLHAQRMIMPRHQDSWTQLGYIVRMAMTMGLHRDPSEFPQLTPFFGEHRRRLWHTIVDMDLHVALACNLPCSAREGEYTCRPPRNLDDEDLYLDMKALPPSKPIDQFTSCQLQAYASSTLPWRLRVSSIISRLDTIQDYQEVLEVGGKLERMLDDINCLFPRHSNLDTQKKYKQWRDRALLDMHVRRPLLDLYRPFALSSANCPAQISTSYLKSCMTMLTYMDELDYGLPGYKDVMHMYQLILKHDIIQASFSVCYYIKNAPDNNGPGPPPGSYSGGVGGGGGGSGGGGGVGSEWLPGKSPSLGETAAGSYDGPFIWSAETLIKTVERSLENLIGIIKDSTSDLRDIVALSIVLNSVQPAPPEQKLEMIKQGVRKILDHSVQVLNAKSDSIASMPPITPIAPSPMDRRPTPDIFTNPAVMNTFVGNDFLASEISDEFPLWDSFLDY